MYGGVFGDSGPLEIRFLWRARLNVFVSFRICHSSLIGGAPLDQVVKFGLVDFFCPPSVIVRPEIVTLFAFEHKLLVTGFLYFIVRGSVIACRRWDTLGCISSVLNGRVCNFPILWLLVGRLFSVLGLSCEPLSRLLRDARL